MNTSYIRHWIKEHFANTEVDEIFDLLRQYYSAPHPDPTYRAVLRLARGDKAALRLWLERAQTALEDVHRAAEFLETWEQVIDSYRKEVEANPWMKARLAVTQHFLDSKQAERFRAGTSVSRLVISANDRHGLDADDPYILISSPDACEEPDLLRIDYFACDAREPVESVICGVQEAPGVLGPFLMRLEQSRGAEPLPQQQPN
ncbi:MAG: hypothetical protein AB1489_12545 [Acidobacteriota bacterium]